MVPMLHLASIVKQTCIFPIHHALQCLQAAWQAASLHACWLHRSSCCGANTMCVQLQVPSHLLGCMQPVPTRVQLLPPNS